MSQVIPMVTILKDGLSALRHLLSEQSRQLIRLDRSAFDAAFEELGAHVALQLYVVLKYAQC